MFRRQHWWRGFLREGFSKPSSLGERPLGGYPLLHFGHFGGMKNCTSGTKQIQKLLFDIHTPYRSYLFCIIFSSSGHYWRFRKIRGFLGLGTILMAKVCSKAVKFGRAESLVQCTSSGVLVCSWPGSTQDIWHDNNIAFMWFSPSSWMDVMIMSAADMQCGISVACKQCGELHDICGVKDNRDTARSIFKDCLPFM